MKPQKRRWSKVYESTEEELVAFLASRQLSATRNDVEALSTATVQLKAEASTIWCAEGSCSIQTADGTISLQPGDYLTLDPRSEYTIAAGISGCVYYI